jgi:hypothetical protein
LKWQVGKRPKFADVNWLGHINIATCFEGALGVAFEGVGGDGDDGGVGQCFLFVTDAQSAGYFIAINIRKVNIEQNQVNLLVSATSTPCKPLMASTKV